MMEACSALLNHTRTTWKAYKSQIAGPTSRVSDSAGRAQKFAFLTTSQVMLLLSSQNYILRITGVIDEHQNLKDLVQ